MNQEFYSVPILQQNPLFVSNKFRDTKDPCPVFDGKIWHIYGSGGSSLVEEWQILHATAENLEGPWIEEEPATLIGISGPHIAAPAVTFDHSDNLFHMFIQVDFLSLNGTIEHLISEDGKNFMRRESALEPIPDTAEAGLYDPHCAEIHGEKYLTYSGIAEVGKPDLFLAKSLSGTWNGPWQRVKKILAHEHVPFHNPIHHPNYEWGLEGSQLVELPNGKVLLVAVCFLPEGQAGTRQRVFFSLADRPEGPYKVLPPVLNPEAHEWQSGENGHAAALVRADKLHLFYQCRIKPQEEATPWRYALADISVNDLENFF